MLSCGVILSANLLLLSAAPSPAYTLKFADSQRIEATLTYKIETPKLTAQEWIVFAARAPELPGQIRVGTTLEPNGKPSFDLSADHRPILMARISALGGGGRDKEITVHVKYEATLRSRRLVPIKRGGGGRGGSQASEALPDQTRQAALELGGLFDGKTEFLRKWSREHQLARRESESDVDFARRVFVAMKRDFTYDYKSEMDRHASAVCKAGKSDCGGLAVMLVTILRANDIPARTLVGRWAESAKPKERIEGLPYYQTHVKAEFFAQGIGWVPVDIALGLRDQRGDGLYFFGNDDGNFLTMHVDPNLRVDTIRFGKKDLEFMQGLAYWVVGQGSIDPIHTTEKWEVRKLR
jgi:transglutaminase-like putative cysteine protease